NALFHFLAGLEGDDVLRLDVDAFAGARVAGLASLALLDLEHAEVAQLDAPLREKRLDDGVERLLHDLLRLELREPKLLRYLLHDFFFGHGLNSPVAGSDPLKR